MNVDTSDPIIKQGIDALDLFMTQLEMEDFSAGTLKVYYSVIINAINIIHKPIQDWVNSDVTRFLKATEEQFNERRKETLKENFQSDKFSYKAYKTRTKLMKTNALRAFIRFCLDERIILTASVKFRQSRDPIENKFDTRVDKNKIIEWMMKVPHRQHAIAFIFQLLQGMRISEIINMKFDWINFVKESDIYWLTIIGKRKKKRTIPIDPAAFELLYDYIMSYIFQIDIKKVHNAFKQHIENKLNKDEYKLFKLIYDHDPVLFLTTEKFSLKPIENENVFKTAFCRADESGHKMRKAEYREVRKQLDPREAFKLLAPFKSPNYFHKALSKVNYKLDIPGIIGKKYTSHANRGNCLTFHWEEGMDIVQLADFAGHSSINTTRGYLKNTPEHLKESFDKTRFLKKLPELLFS
jgi:integrase